MPISLGPLSIECWLKFLKMALNETLSGSEKEIGYFSGSSPRLIWIDLWATTQGPVARGLVSILLLGGDVLLPGGCQSIDIQKGCCIDCSTLFVLAAGETQYRACAEKAVIIFLKLRISVPDEKTMLPSDFPLAKTNLRVAY